jgi:hypothetical protein
MAERAGATITEVEGSRMIMISQPQVVTDVILTAVADVGRRERGSLVGAPALLHVRWALSTCWDGYRFPPR